MDVFKKVVSGVFLSSVGVSAVSASAGNEVGTLTESVDGHQGILDRGAVFDGKAADSIGENEVEGEKIGPGALYTNTKGTVGLGVSSFADDWRLAEQYYGEASGKLLKLRDTLLATKLKSELDNERQKCSGSENASSRVVYRQKAFEILAKVDRLLGLQEIDDAATERANEQERQKRAEELRAQRDEIDNSIYKLQEKQLESKLNGDKYQIILERINILRERLLKVESATDVKNCWDDFYDINSKYDAFLREQYRQDEEKLLQEITTFQRDNAKAIDELEKRIDSFEEKAFVRRDKAKELVKKLRTLLREVTNPFDMIAYNEEFLQCREKFEVLEKEDQDAKVEKSQNDLKLKEFDMLGDTDRVARLVKEGKLGLDFVYVGNNELKKQLTKYLNRSRKYLGLDKSRSGFSPSVAGGVVLYGRPGAGKTSGITMIGSSCDCDVITVRCGEWTGRGVREFQAYLDDVISSASRSDRLVIINLDDADRMLAPSTSFSGYILSCLDNERAKGKASRVRFCITCNDKDRLDSALLRGGRVAGSYEVVPPKVDELEQLLRNYCSFHRISDDIEFAEIAEKCRDATPAFVKEVFNQAVGFFLDEKEDAADPSAVKLSQRHFDEGFEAAKRSVLVK